MANLSVRTYLAVNRFDATAGLRPLLPTGQPGLREFISVSRLRADRLQPGQRLKVGDSLTPNSGRLTLTVETDGDVTLFRTMFGTRLWSTNTTATPAVALLMQADGDLVALTASRNPVWRSGTASNPGSACVLQDDGNFVVKSPTGSMLWASNTVQDFQSPAYVYSAADSFTYDETSESWKELCLALPCFDALQWPDYASKHVDTVIDGQPVVIQLWKGWCEKFLGLNQFPGGVGAEVGIYRRMPGRARPASLSFLPSALEDVILTALKTLSDDQIWWPFPELGATTQYSLINPITEQTFFSAGPETTYWLAKWMFDGSYSDYQAAQGSGRTPTFSTGYTLRHSVNGIAQQDW
jgi:hypothetical protein